MSDMTGPSNSEVILAAMVAGGSNREWSLEELEAVLRYAVEGRFSAATPESLRRAVRDAVLRLCGRGEIFSGNGLGYRLARVRPPLPRQPAAIHIRVRDLRAGDVVVGEGAVLSIKPYPDRSDEFVVSLTFHTHAWSGSRLVLVVVDGGGE